MKEELSKQQTDAILKALDDAIAQGPWDKSNFLRVIGKNLQEIQSGFSKHLEGSAQELARKTGQHAPQKTLSQDQREVFIALYSSDGMNLQSWERILSNLPRQVISRPIYAQEEDVQELIKTKENKNNEAYVSMYIHQEDILSMSSDKIHVDKLGKPLLTLKDRALLLENINHFVHLSGRYRYVQGRLVKHPIAENGS